MEFPAVGSLRHVTRDSITPAGRPSVVQHRPALQIADALARAHGEGIVHRDLKPAIVMLGKSGAKLMDFGLARTNSPGSFAASSLGSTSPLSKSPTIAQPLTSAGTLLGTFQYMAPELLDGGEADARSDVWALGCVLYEMATGRRAFDGATQASVISTIMKEEPPPFVEAAPLIPASLAYAVRACLAKDPERRWQSARDVAIALAGALSEDTRAAPSTSIGVRERQFALTAEHVRQLTDRNPRLVGYPVHYIDNRVDSDALVVFVHGVGAHSSRFAEVVRRSRERAIAVDLVGFSPNDRHRPVLGIDDHSRVLRSLLREFVAERPPRQTLLVGHSAGADQILRMIHGEGGAGVEVTSLIALSPNVSLATCFASRLFAKMDATEPGRVLAVLKTLGSDIDSLEVWLAAQSYVSETFMKLGTDLEPLRRYSADIIAPFEELGDPLSDWYRAARDRIPFVRLVFSREEQDDAETLIARHLENNVLGDAFTVDSLVIEPVSHLGLLDPDLIARHVRDAMKAGAG